MKATTKYKKACEGLLEAFIDTYYVDEDISREDVDAYWVAEDIGGTVFINDDWWSCELMLDALDLKVDPGKLFEWYHDVYINEKTDPKYNLKNYLQLKP